MAVDHHQQRQKPAADSRPGQVHAIGRNRCTLVTAHSCHIDGDRPSVHPVLNLPAAFYPELFAFGNKMILGDRY